MNRLNLIIPIVLITGCVSLHKTAKDMDAFYNVDTYGTSEFDGTKHIRMTHIRCEGITFRLYQDTSKAKRGVVLLKAGVLHTSNIADGESLQIKSDGKVYPLQTNDVITKFTSDTLGSGMATVELPISLKTYIVPQSTIEAIAKSNAFIARVHLLDKSYVEGNCSFRTLQEVKDELKKANLSSRGVDQKFVEISNQYTALAGFRKFVRMMDEAEL
jgi:hypothetical protein